MERFFPDDTRRPPRWQVLSAERARHQEIAERFAWAGSAVPFFLGNHDHCLLAMACHALRSLVQCAVGKIPETREGFLNGQVRTAAPYSVA